LQDTLLLDLAKTTVLQNLLNMRILPRLSKKRLSRVGFWVILKWAFKKTDFRQKIKKSIFKFLRTPNFKNN
jgi:hypothetical protein